MKNVKILLALVVALGIGYGFNKGISILDNEAVALENEGVVLAAAPTTKDVPEVKVSAVSTDVANPIEFNRELANEMIDAFVAPLQMGDEYGKITQFTSLEDIVENHYTSFTKEEIARSFVHNFFYEENGELYIVPTDGVLFHNTELPAEVVEITETHYQVRQVLSSDQDTSVIDFEYYGAEEKWKLTNVTFE